MAGRSSAKLLLAHAPHDVLRPITLGNLSRERSLVLSRALKLFERQRDGADLLLAGIAHQSEQRARVDARRQKNPHLDIRQKMRFDAIENGGANARLEFDCRHGIFGALGEDRRDAGKWPRLTRTRSIDPLAVTRR